jgi:hypothetical protein
MTTCAVAVQQPDGAYVLQLAPSITDVSTCSYVVQSGADVAGSLLMMSAKDGATYSVAIVAMWSGAWIFKMLIKTLKGDSNESEN